MIRVKALMVIGNGDGCVKIITVYQNEDNDIHIIPRTFKDDLITITERDLGALEIQERNFTIDPGLKDGDVVDSFDSMSLSIAIGIQACCSWRERWEEEVDGIIKWKEWCLTGEVNNVGNIVKIDGINEKLRAALFGYHDDEVNNFVIDHSIRFIMIPSGNKTEAIKWIDAKKKDGVLETIENKDNTNEVKDHFDNQKPRYPDPKRIWSLITKNRFTVIAFVIWVLSTIIVPLKLFYWDSIVSLWTGIPQITIKLPIKYPEKVSEMLIDRGFLHPPVQFASKAKQGKVVFKNVGVTTEVENIKSDIWVIITCCIYITIGILLTYKYYPPADPPDSPGNGPNKWDFKIVRIRIDNRKVKIFFVDNLSIAINIVQHHL
ncbi:MAG: hypothetical protein SCARUB_00760 [Candidatus Scalindua rubra]|uniref:Uncharacterized protein n=1 Tax=Candidatus Scalindua rubra TaxID=1872076 RepID=A0A1E3XEM3_9BACT|nr:MAG: hypothetical protein SCARUB_00760 [Candidatus Scalindua rubra]